MHASWVSPSSTRRASGTTDEWLLHGEQLVSVPRHHGGWHNHQPAEPAASGTSRTSGTSGTSRTSGDSGRRRFVDDDGSVHEPDIELIAAAGITSGCNPPTNSRYCPDGVVSRGQMAAFLVRALDLPATSKNFFSDDAGSIFEGDINRLAAAGITSGLQSADEQPVLSGSGRVAGSDGDVLGAGVGSAGDVEELLLG